MKRKSLQTIMYISILLFMIAINKRTVLAEGEPVKIYTESDLLKIADEPAGDYILMNDLDMRDTEWVPVDFTGTFDGNNHAILNLKIRNTSDATRTTYDGNYKTYDTYFAGLFGVLEDATVKNLTLKGIDVHVQKEEPCFIGSIAGFAERSNIENCNIEGMLQLDVKTKMFGVGGIVGYGGDGAIKETSATVTLICIDYDAANRDEQFMGGAYSAGYLDVDKCYIKIDGYDSDHGYVHNGGLVGMYILYPLGNNYAGYINNTRVEGIITFFEDNTDRRAYCKDFIGEVMNWTYEYVGNSSDFTRNEIKDYSKNLLPHYCEGNEYDKEEIPGSCEEFGFNVYTCRECGEYKFKANYTLKNHDITEWETIEEPTFEEEGLAKGVCSICQSEVYKILPVKEEEIIEEPVVVEEVAPVEDTTLEQAEVKEEEKDEKAMGTLLVIGLVISLGLVVAIATVLLRGRHKKR